jgi:hypothetical protein
VGSMGRSDVGVVSAWLLTINWMSSNREGFGKTSWRVEYLEGFEGQRDQEFLVDSW